jgi:hypothetical protein
MGTAPGEPPAIPVATAPAEPHADAPVDSTPVDLDDVIVAWGAIVPEFMPATRSAVQHAQPLRFDGDVLVFGVPPQLLGAARERFRREAETVREALAARLGRRFKFNLEAAPEFIVDGSSESGAGTQDAARETGGSSLTEAASELPPESVDPDDTTEIPPEDDPPPVNRLRDELGATVVEEVPRGEQGATRD